MSSYSQSSVHRISIPRGDAMEHKTMKRINQLPPQEV